MQRGATAIGIKARDGVVIATEKKAATPLVDPASVKKVAVLAPRTGAVYAGAWAGVFRGLAGWRFLCAAKCRTRLVLTLSRLTPNAAAPLRRW